MAASGGHTEVIRFLNSKGVDIGALDKVSAHFSMVQYRQYTVALLH